MSYDNFPLVPLRKPQKQEKRKKRPVPLRDILAGILGNGDPIARFNPTGGLSVTPAPAPLPDAPAMRSWGYAPPSPEIPPPPGLAPDTGGGKVPLPPGFMESLPPTRPTLGAMDTNVSPRPTLPELPPAPRRNRRGEAREALKGGAIAGLLGLLLSRGDADGGIKALVGYGQGAGRAADASFEDREAQYRADVTERERADQNRQIDWMNAEAGREARNQGVKAANDNALTEYGLDIDRYNRGETARLKRIDQRRQQKKDDLDAINDGLTIKLKEKQIGLMDEDRDNARALKLTPEQQFDRDTIRDYRRMQDPAIWGTLTPARKQWFTGQYMDALKRSGKALGLNGVPQDDPKLTPKEQRQFAQGDRRLDQGDTRLDLQREANGIRQSRTQVLNAVSGYKKSKAGDPAKILTDLQTRIQTARNSLYSKLPKGEMRQIALPDGTKTSQWFEPSAADMEAYNLYKGETERYIQFLYGQISELSKAGRGRQPDTKTASQRFYETATAGTPYVPPGGVAPVVINKPLNGYDDHGRRIINPPLPQNTVVGKDGYVTDRPTTRPLGRTAPAPRTKATPKATGGNRGKDVSRMSDAELLRAMAGGQK